MTAGVEAELRVLRRGEGLRARHAAQKIGPELRALAGIAAGTETADAVNRLTAWLSRAVSDLEQPLRLAALAALALPPAQPSRYLRDRLNWLARQLRCDERTARRRIDQAFNRIAEAAERSNRPSTTGSWIPDEGWYVSSFTALLRLDLPMPEALELRSVVATRDGVAELATSISVPRDTADRRPSHLIDVELLYGGRLEWREQPYESYFRNTITLAAPLNTGDNHWYAMRIRIPPNQPMAPHYVHVPLVRSDYFDLRIRFDPAHLPEQVWRLHGVPTAVISDNRPGSDLIHPDRFGEIRCEFRDMSRGLGYGVSWSTTPTAHATR